jgi:formylglycine-generating enzyme required for sulfatase activity
VTALRDQPPECAWNTDIKPNATCLTKLDNDAASPYVCLDRTEACDNVPQTCIDWCDAYYYCTWAGKRLCGKIGGGPVGSTQGTNPAVSQWLNACSSAGQREFPYGGAFDDKACYSRPDAGYPMLPTRSFPGCVTPAGVFDMSGSVAEWEDSCATRNGPEDICVYRGGSFLTDPEPVLFDCVHQQGRARGLAAKWRGFRCCFP